ncbi:MAG TPA: hypothetical protein VLC46_08910 [Thermoanaerobaculia bacterium]|nr:hypothetical protein [Thermoanaerobaculia bacterium]
MSASSLLVVLEAFSGVVMWWKEEEAVMCNGMPPGITTFHPDQPAQ